MYNWKKDVPAVVQLAHAAGRAILQARQKELIIEVKPDGSRRTNADLASESVIISGLRERTPHIPIVSEESVDQQSLSLLLCEQVWVVDPLDSTHNFIDGKSGYCINIALVEKGRPVFGVIHGPDRQLTVWNDGKAVWQKKGKDQAEMITPYGHPTGLTLVTGGHPFSYGGKDYLEEWLRNNPQLGIATHVTDGSALKFCLVAAGGAHFYLRAGKTCVWDNAPGQAIIEQAGGSIMGLDGLTLSYQKQLEHPGFIVWNNRKSLDIYRPEHKDRVILRPEPR